MFGLKFSKLPAHRTFSYRPIYYDKKKTALNNQVERIKREMGEKDTTAGDVKDSIKNAYESKRNVKRYSTGPSNRFYSLKIVLLASIFGILVFKFLNSNAIEIIFGHLNK